MNGRMVPLSRFDTSVTVEFEAPVLKCTNGCSRWEATCVASLKQRRDPIHHLILILIGEAIVQVQHLLGNNWRSQYRVQSCQWRSPGCMRSRIQ